MSLSKRSSHQQNKSFELYLDPRCLHLCRLAIYIAYLVSGLRDGRIVHRFRKVLVGIKVTVEPTDRLPESADALDPTTTRYCSVVDASRKRCKVT